MCWVRICWSESSLDPIDDVASRCASSTTTRCTVIAPSSVEPQPWCALPIMCGVVSSTSHSRSPCIACRLSSVEPKNMRTLRPGANFLISSAHCCTRVLFTTTTVHLKASGEVKIPRNDKSAADAAASCAALLPPPHPLSWRKLLNGPSAMRLALLLCASTRLVTTSVLPMPTSSASQPPRIAAAAAGEALGCSSCLTLIGILDEEAEEEERGSGCSCSSGSGASAASMKARLCFW